MRQVRCRLDTDRRPSNAFQNNCSPFFPFLTPCWSLNPDWTDDSGFAVSSADFLATGMGWVVVTRVSETGSRTRLLLLYLRTFVNHY